MSTDLCRHAVDRSAIHDLGGCARLLGQPRSLLWWLTRRGRFAAPVDHLDGRPRWREREVYEWAVARAPDVLANRIPLAYWPQATSPAPYWGSLRSGHATLLSWQTPVGTLWLVWPDPEWPYERVLVRAHEELGAGPAAIVAVGGDFGPRGPAVHAIVPATGATYEPSWPQLARVLGQPVPYWPYSLRIPDLLTAWRPGAAQAVAATIPDLDTASLLRLAAVFDDDVPAQQVLVNLARIAQHRTTDSALNDLKILADYVEPGTIEVAAIPMSMPEDERGDLDEAVRRVGWLEILGRADTLAISCVQEAMKWDGGDDFPYSNPEVVDTRTPCGAEWAKRLLSSRRTAAFEIMDNGGWPDGEAGCLIDPETDAPVATTDADDKLSTAIPRRLPATSPLAEIILDQTIWVRTQDGTLYPAPKHSYYGLSWGYPGTGPGTLALLIHRLLDDINAPGADGATSAPEGLEALTEIDWPHGTVLSRAQLEAAREDRPPGAGGR
ncbi:hypothetical protein [Spongiactinospora sp. TRM90649]|uniref:helix-turn-helix transcriptional regulator n=1 Tax=Spongiactinospora sp. TRM90649 TaxID=3031114 RepID=UPI0023F6F5BE|nr:hypothetical protein [Spongiactinospora sp. TRM90649]MDF5758390.1 hypothetical protein [Spongiactinospora sp. TRM90649]